MNKLAGRWIEAGKAWFWKQSFKIRNSQLETFKQLEVNNEKPNTEHSKDLESRGKGDCQGTRSQTTKQWLGNWSVLFNGWYSWLEDQLKVPIPNAQESTHDMEVSNEGLNGKNLT
jgi:hypothetical protein